MSSKIRSLVVGLVPGLCSVGVYALTADSAAFIQVASHVLGVSAGALAASKLLDLVWRQ
jgi:hypothetical protein